MSHDTSPRTDAAALVARLRYPVPGDHSVPAGRRCGCPICSDRFNAADTIDRLTRELAAQAETEAELRNGIGILVREKERLAAELAESIQTSARLASERACEMIDRRRAEAERDTLRRALEDHAAGWRRTAAGVRDGEARRWLRACADDVVAITELRETEAARTERWCIDCGKLPADECFTVCSSCWNIAYGRQPAAPEPKEPQP